MFFIFCSPFRTSTESCFARSGDPKGTLWKCELRRAHCARIELAFLKFYFYFLALQEQEQGASAAQELPHETIEATQEVSTDVADVKEASEDVMAPPPSSETTEALAEGEAPLCEEEKEVKTTQSPSTEPETSKKEVEVVEEEAPEPAAAARRSKPAAKKPLVGRKPLAAKKVRVFGAVHFFFCYQHRSSVTKISKIILFSAG